MDRNGAFSIEEWRPYMPPLWVHSTNLLDIATALSPPSVDCNWQDTKQAASGNNGHQKCNDCLGRSLPPVNGISVLELVFTRECEHGVGAEGAQKTSNHQWANQ